MEQIFTGKIFEIEKCFKNCRKLEKTLSERCQKKNVKNRIYHLFR